MIGGILPLINDDRQSSKQLLSLESFSRILQLPVPEFSKFIGLPVAASGGIEGRQPALVAHVRVEALHEPKIENAFVLNGVADDCNLARIMGCGR